MEATLSQGLQLGTWMDQHKIVGKPSSCLRILPTKSGEQRWNQTPNSSCFLTKKGRFLEPVALKISCSSKALPVRESRSVQVSFDESQVLKKKSEEVEPYLNGRCIYIVGMMGSGKTTVGKVLSEALGYSFYDCDALIEQAVGETAVAEIFKLHGESFFRDNETEVLHKLSSMNRLVVSTGGGAVVRPINWRHMRKGITVFLDVPLEALARRITAVGTGSRPLLHHESGDHYTKTMKRLSTLYEERGKAYENADARVSLENIAVKLGLEDVCDITPTAIATEALIQIEGFVTE